MSTFNTLVLLSAVYVAPSLSKRNRETLAICWLACAVVVLTLDVVRHIP